MQLPVIWDPVLEPDPEGPALIPCRAMRDRKSPSFHTCVAHARRQTARGVHGDVELLHQDTLGHGPSFLPRMTGAARGSAPFRSGGGRRSATVSAPLTAKGAPASSGPSLGQRGSRGLLSRLAS